MTNPSAHVDRLSPSEGRFDPRRCRFSKREQAAQASWWKAAQNLSPAALRSGFNRFTNALQAQPGTLATANWQARWDGPTTSTSLEVGLRGPTMSRTHRRFLLPITILFTVASLVLTGSPAQAANYTATTERYASSNDAGGIDTKSWLDKQGVSNFQHYFIEFISHSEVLWYFVDSRMASRGKITVQVYDRSGRHVDTDTFTVDIGSVGSFQLGTPDGTRDIPEGYDVYTRICVGLSDTCTPYVMGNA